MTAGSSVAYLLNIYPGALTYVATEIDELRSVGVDVLPMSINAVDRSTLIDDRDRVELKRTFAIKSRSKAAIVRDVIGVARSQPGRFARTVRLAVGFEPLDVRRALWRLFYVIEACVVLAELRRRNVTHVHAHFGGAPSFVAWYAGELSGDVTWSMTVHGPHDFFEERVNQLRDKVSSATFTVAISDFTKSQLMRITDDPAVWSKIRVVRCGIDLDAFSFTDRPLRSPLRLLTTARLASEKGQSVMLDAVALLRDRGHEVSLDLVGSGPARHDLETRIDALGLAGSVRLHGALPPADVARLLAESDVFCLPSFAEGLPISIMEAMASGAPVVASAINGTPELVVDEVTGRLVIAGRADAVADAIESIIREPQAARDRAKAARVAVEQNHDATSSAGQLAALFGSLRLS